MSDLLLEIPANLAGGTHAVYGSFRDAQTFTLNAGTVVDSISVYVDNYGGNPEYGLRMIFAGGIDFFPIYVDTEIDPDEVNYGGWTTYSFTPIELTYTGSYAVQLLSILSQGDYPYKMDGSTTAYASGKGYRTTDDGSTWNDYGADFPLRIYGTAAPELSKPTDPTPANDATGVDFSDFTLSWEDGGGAETYDVYIGKTGDLSLISIGQAGTSYVTSLAELEFIFDASPVDQKIYWRVDANADGDTATGDEWNFDPRPLAADNPTPADEAINQLLNLTQLEWEAGV